MTTSIALVVAAGRGTRIDGALPKQYLRVGGKPLIRHALEILGAHHAIGGVRVVYHPDDRPLYDAAIAGLGSCALSRRRGASGFARLGL